MAISIGHHWIEHIDVLPAPFNVVHMDTLITAWLAMGLVIIFSLIATKKLSLIPSKIQTFAEMIMSFFTDMVKSMGKEGKKHIPLLASLFLFILISNLLGQLPWKLYHLESGEFASPTNDINVTAGLAILVLIYYIGAGVIKKGPKYFLHYLKPYPIMAPLNMMEDLIRPLTLALRLFANILAGEILIMTIITLAPVGGPLPFMLFELFVAFIQALVFTLLTSAYIMTAIEDNH